MRPYIVLGTYYPKVWKTWKVGPELCAITKAHGLVPHKDPVHGPLKLRYWWYDEKLHAEVRRRTLADPKAVRGTQWHQDGDLDPGSIMNCALVTWCNKEPTEFLYKDVIYQPEPYQVVISRNLCGSHRRPPNAPKERWLFRQRVAVPKHLKLP